MYPGVTDFESGITVNARGSDAHGNLLHAISNAEPWSQMTAVERSRLIAAVPSLLRELKEATQYVAKLSAEGNVFAERRLRSMEAAIAKAEGAS